MDEITTGWNQLSLQDPEEENFDLQSEMGSKDFTLAANFQTKRVLIVEAVAQNFPQLWHTRITVIILSSLSSKISLIVTKFSLLSPGVSISFWWFFKGTKIASTFKTWIRVMEGGDHVRIRVILDISKPLCRRRKITLDGGNAGWVSFKYERLPSI